MLWHPSGFRTNLQEYLTAAGINLSKWELRSAVGISADGRAIVGRGLHNGIDQSWIATIPHRTFCYPNCDNSSIAPILNVDDFTCFINEFAIAVTLPTAQQHTHYANCDANFQTPIINVDDFTCFLIEFAQGCN